MPKRYLNCNCNCNYINAGRGKKKILDVHSQCTSQPLKQQCGILNHILEPTVPIQSAVPVWFIQIFAIFHFTIPHLRHAWIFGKNLAYCPRLIRLPCWIYSNLFKLSVLWYSTFPLWLQYILNSELDFHNLFLRFRKKLLRSQQKNVQQSASAHNIRGHSISTWTRWGGRGTVCWSGFYVGIS